MSSLRSFTGHRETRAHRSRRRLAAIGALTLLFAVAGNLAAQTGASAAEIKRITDRYTLTRTRIGALLDQRLKPAPLPANLPNPFYQASAAVDGSVLPGHDPVDTQVPAAADESDIDTLRKFAASLKIGGIITRNGVPHLTINNAACKVGDIITVGNKDNPTYLKLVALTAAEFTLGLNDATLSIPLRK
jgi:hypothetical protein